MFIKERLREQEVVRKIDIGVANVLNGTFVSFSSKFAQDDLISMVHASIAFPGLYSPIERFESLWFSGSAIWNIDTTGPILRCRSLGYADKDIVPDAILGNHAKLKY